MPFLIPFAAAIALKPQTAENRCSSSNTPDRHADDVIDLNRFLHDEGLTVFDANEIAIEPGDCGKALLDFSMRRKEIGCGIRVSVLRLVTEQRLHTARKLTSHIDYKRGRDVRIQR